jgi:hypothetical protein
MSNTWRYTIKEYDGSVLSCKIVVGNPLCPAGSQFNGIECVKPTAPAQIPQQQQSSNCICHKCNNPKTYT